MGSTYWCIIERVRGKVNEKKIIILFNTNARLILTRDKKYRSLSNLCDKKLQAPSSLEEGWGEVKDT